MAAILVVPGRNAVLQTAARQLAQRDDALILESANAALWQTRRQPPEIILTDMQLPDMRGSELAEIVPSFAPSARVVICGSDTPEVAARVVAAGATWLPLSGRADDDLRAVYRILGLQPPMAQPPLHPTPGEPPAAVRALERHDMPERNTARESGAAVDVPSGSAPVTETAGQAPPARHGESSHAAPGATAARHESSLAVARHNGGDGFRRGDALVIHRTQHRQLEQLLALMARETEAQCVLLVDQAGMIFIQSRSLSGVALEAIAPLVATTFSATRQLERQLGEEHARAAYIHEGQRFDLYAFNVDSRLSLLVIFDRRLKAGKLGTVWVYARRVMRQIQQIIGA